MTQPRPWCFIVSTLTIIAGLTGCSSDDDDGTNNSKPPTSGNEVAPPASSSHPLLVVTERDSPDADGALHYLHVLDDWPSSGELDYGKAIELGSPGVSHAAWGAFYFYQAEEGSIEKITFDDDGKPQRGNIISFANDGITGYDPEPIWGTTKDVAYMLDEKSGKIARWNPDDLGIDDVVALPDDVLKRDDLKVQFQLGIAANKHLYTTVNWRNWDTFTAFPGASIGIFDEDDLAKGPTTIDDDRCAPSVAVGVWEDDAKYIYLVGDGAQGFDMKASPKPSPKPQCVLRLKEGADAFDPDFFIDLNELTGSPVVFMTYPMADHKLLANIWSPEVNIDDIDPKTGSPDWWWEYQPYFEWVIIDLDDKSVSHVDALERGAVQSQKTLRIDDDNYIQLFRDDRGSTVHRIETDGTVTQVLSNPDHVSAQYIGRL
jgi:hypothetical protein